MEDEYKYKIFENAITGIVLTIRFNLDTLEFNHQSIHKAEEYEGFEPEDLQIESVNGVDMHHLNGKLLNVDEYNFIYKILDDVNS